LEAAPLSAAVPPLAGARCLAVAPEEGKSHRPWLRRLVLVVVVAQRLRSVEEEALQREPYKFVFTENKLIKINFFFLLKIKIEYNL
jgi:hypothetical protein